MFFQNFEIKVWNSVFDVKCHSWLSIVSFVFNAGICRSSLGLSHAVCWASPQPNDPGMHFSLDSCEAPSLMSVLATTVPKQRCCAKGNVSTQHREFQGGSSARVQLRFTATLTPHDHLQLPTDVGFPLKAYYKKVESKRESDELRAYLLQARQELSARLAEIVIDPNSGKPSKWWMCFTKRKFLGQSLDGAGGARR